ncbi:hypothetical protein KXX64_001896 [Aspergillus fumigatus]|nr:hypothetical protein KXX64_001896 [Aspergillus fumigatus]KAH1662402.1 hypothetical protein KXX15_000631 [Aspergillus fumigatus]KAH2815725.1 hypothetical protein KXV23_002179 [Aspergillus fumigatus]KAH3217993.1 hypothetical protein KXV86_000374 [Aspergillus fumigatus]
MRLPAIIPSALLGVAFVFAVIELGLGGHIASISTGSRKIPFYDPSSSWGYSYKTIKYSVPGIVAFQIFTSVWTMLVSVAAFLLPWFLRVKAAPGTRLNTIITGALGGAYFVTMVFWLACFADIATKLDELGATSDYYNANSEKTSAVGIPPPGTRCGIGILLAVILGECACCDKEDCDQYKSFLFISRNTADTDDVVQQDVPQLSRLLVSVWCIDACLLPS